MVSCIDLNSLEITDVNDADINKKVINLVNDNCTFIIDDGDIRYDCNITASNNCAEFSYVTFDKYGTELFDRLHHLGLGTLFKLTTLSNDKNIYLYLDDEMIGYVGSIV